MSVRGIASDATGDAAPVWAGAGNDWPWEQLYHDLAPGLIGLSVRRFGLSHADGEDALQKAAMDIVEAGPAARNRDAYLTTCFLHECLKIARRRKTREPATVPLEAADHLGDNPEGRIEAAIVFHRAMAQIPARCRKIIRAHALEGRDILESARLSEWSLSNAHRGFKRCWKKLSDAIT